MIDIVNLIHRTEAAQADEAERKALTDWIAENPENKGDYEALRILLGYSEPLNTDGVTEGELNRGYERIQSGIREIQKRKFRFRWQVTGSLAFLALLLPVIYIYTVQPARIDSLQFTNEPLGNVIDALEKGYSLKIKPESSALLNCQFTGVIFITDSVKEVFDAISTTMNIEFVEKPDGSFEFSGKGCPRSGN